MAGPGDNDSSKRAASPVAKKVTDWLDWLPTMSWRVTAKVYIPSVNPACIEVARVLPTTKLALMSAPPNIAENRLMST